jgi:hypothetical protein
MVVSLIGMSTSVGSQIGWLYKEDLPVLRFQVRLRGELFNDAGIIS